MQKKGLNNKFRVALEKREKESISGRRSRRGGEIFVSPCRPRLKKRANFGERARKSRLLLLFHPDFNWRDNHLIAQQTTFCYHQLYTRLAARNGQCQCWFIMPPRLLALALSHSQFPFMMAEGCAQPPARYLSPRLSLPYFPAHPAGSTHSRRRKWHCQVLTHWF